MAISSTQALLDMVDIKILHYLSDLHTALPCKVVTYYESKQAVDIQPLLKKEYSNGYVADIPVIKNVPLIFQGTSTSLISFPISVGDIVLAVFCERSTDKWVSSTGSSVNPQSGIMHDITDCFAIPGLQTFKTHQDPNPDNFEVRFNTNTSNECSVKMYQDGSINIDSPKKITLTGGSSSIEMDDSGIALSGERIDLN